MLAIALAVAGYWNRGAIALKIKSVYVKVPPKAVDAHPQGPRVAGAFTGDAPWALSALPECFMQIGKSTSPSLHYVLAHVPPNVTMVRPPAVLHYADCTLRVSGDQVFVTRGVDRMRIPPQSRLYTGGKLLVLLRGSSQGYDLRTYTVK